MRTLPFPCQKPNLKITLNFSKGLDKLAELWYNYFRSLNMIPNSVSQIMTQLNSNGFQAYVVGGAVRDIVLGKEPSDFDIATDATPDDAHCIFGEAAKSTPNSRQHGTVFVHGIDVTTFRTDHDEDGFSARVEFADSILDDVGRRDFTFNGMAMLPNGEIYDPFDGQGDLTRKVLRAIGNPVDRMRESYVRMLRACRFMSLDSEMTMEVFLHSAIEKERASIHYVPVELIQHELMKMMAYPAPMNGIHAMLTTGLLENILPDLAVAGRIAQENCHKHKFDVLTHCVLTMSAIPADRPLLRFTALLHDIGKSETHSVDEDGGVHFYRHEEVGAEIAERIMKGLRFSNDEIGYATTLIREHMTLSSYFAPTTMKGVRRLLIRLGDVPIEDLLLLKAADRFARDGQEKDNSDEEDRIRRMVAQIRAENHALKVTDLAISGDDLIEMGLEPGPLFGEILKGLLEEVLEVPQKNEHGYLLGRIKVKWADWLYKPHQI